MTLMRYLEDKSGLPGLNGDAPEGTDPDPAIDASGDDPDEVA